MNYHLFLLVALLAACQATQKPKGIHLDIEPYALSQWTTDQNNVCNQFLDLLENLTTTLSGTGIMLTVDVPFWYNTISVTRNSVTKGMHQWVADSVERVLIMAYRDWASGARNTVKNTAYNGRTDSQVFLSSEEMAYANATNKKVVIATETMAVSPPYVGYSEDGSTYFESQLAIVRSAYQATPAFDSNAVHYYQTAKALTPTYTLTNYCNKSRDLFLWDVTVVTNTAKRNQLLTYCTDHAVRTVYAEVSSLIKTNTAAVTVFMDAAASSGISVEFLYGDPLWALTAYHADAYGFVQASLDYVAALSSPTAPVTYNCIA